MTKPSNKKIIKKFKFPIDLIEFPIKYSEDAVTKKDDEGKRTLEVYLKGKYGPYHIETPRKYKLMDIRTLLATLYFTDYHKERIYTERFTNWLNLLEVEDTGFYRKSIIEGLDYLKKTTFYTPCLYDTEKQTRDYFNLKEDRKIDWKNLPSFSVWSILDSYHHLSEERKRKSEIKLYVGDSFYERIFKDRFFSLINFKKVLPLRDIALNLYLFVKRQDPKNIGNFPNNFKLFKEHIGITTKNITWARQIFEKAWQDIQDEGLLSDYEYKIREGKIWFYIKKSLEKSV
ncbi:hypothetical protein ES702_03644 [subsurface metagenome]